MGQTVKKALMSPLDATDAAFCMGGVLCNLLAEFRETVLLRRWFEKRLRAARNFVFLVGADLIHQGAECRFGLPCQSPTERSFCAAYARCPRVCRLRHRWNGARQTKLRPIPTK
jgi:hypothetical protein